MVAGAGLGGETSALSDAIDWSQTIAGPWLAETLAALRRPEGNAGIDPGALLHATLRPYQLAGVQWLHLLTHLRLGACLADDMGLGKTIQVLSLLLVLKQESGGSAQTLPAGGPGFAARQLGGGNRKVRAEPRGPHRAPVLRATAKPCRRDGDLAGVDLVITTYGYLARAPWLVAKSWQLVVLDEAQAIKNPSAKQTATVKKLRADGRIALTGTPIENRLWRPVVDLRLHQSGFAGLREAVFRLRQNLAERPHNPYGPLRELVRPYILRRLKTDKSIIADLPDKTEVKTFCPLSKKQAALMGKPSPSWNAG